MGVYFLILGALENLFWKVNVRCFIGRELTLKYGVGSWAHA